jgi:hypothetical protein
VIFKRVIISLVDNKIENRKIAHSSREVMGSLFIEVSVPSQESER